MKISMMVADVFDRLFKADPFQFTDIELQWMETGARIEREECARIIEKMDEFKTSDEEHDALWSAANKIRSRSTIKPPSKTADILP